MTVTLFLLALNSVVFFGSCFFVVTGVMLLWRPRQWSESKWFPALPHVRKDLRDRLDQGKGRWLRWLTAAGMIFMGCVFIGRQLMDLLTLVASR